MRALLATAAAALALSACAHAAPRPEAAPAVGPPASLPAAAAATTLPNGLRVLRVPGLDGAFEAALLVAAGPLDDPAALPGLTEWAMEAALLGTLGDPDEETPPERRALLVGGEVLPVADGRVAGWLVAGPEAAAGPLLRLLGDVAGRPAVPATAHQLRATLAREAVEAKGGEDLDRAIGLGLGLAVGVPRPVALGPTSGLLERVNREDVVRHLARLVRPERAVLLVAAPPRVDVAPLLAPLAGPWPGGAPPAAEEAVAPCLPRGQSRHLVLSEEGAASRAVTLFGAAAPGPGDPDRAALEAALAHLAESPLGPLEAALDPDQARRARPQIVDLGVAGGRAVSVLLAGTAGEPAEALRDLKVVMDALVGLGTAGALDAEAAEGAARAARAARLAARTRPAGRLVSLATDALYGEDATPVDAAAIGAAPVDAAAIIATPVDAAAIIATPVDAAAINATPVDAAAIIATPVDAAAIIAAAGRWLAPWRFTVVAWGGAETEAALAGQGPVSVWGPDGVRRRGPEPPACLPFGPPGEAPAP